MAIQNETALKSSQIHFLHALLDGKRQISELEAKTRADNLCLNWLILPCVVVCVSPIYTNIPYDIKDNLILQVSDYVCSYLAKKDEKYYYCLTNSYDNLQIILSIRENNINEEEVDKLFIRLHQKFKQHFGMELFIGIGSVVNKYTEISRSALEAMEMLAYKYQFADRGVINIINTFRYKHYSIYGEDIMFARVIGQFQDGNIVGISNRLTELTESIRNRPNVSKTAIKRTFIELTANILHVASNSGVDVDSIIGKTDFYLWIMQQNHTEVLSEWFLSLCGDLLEKMHTGKILEENKIIHQASDYILQHLHDPQLNLIDVSRAVGLSPSYLSQLFKTEKGVGLNNFITENRIQHAKQMLNETEMKSEDIALMIGFSSATYFSRVFKKYTGLTPNQFRVQSRFTPSK